MKLPVRIIVAAAVLGAVFMSGASAGISSTVFALQAVNNSGTSTFSVGFGEGDWDAGTGVYTWSLGGSMGLYDDTNPGDYVATLESASLTIHTGAAPEIILNLGVIAGDSNTEFLVDTAQVDFPTIPAALAEGGFTANGHVWDNQADYAYMIGLDDLGEITGMGAFRSRYNGDEVFSHLLSVVSATAGSDGGGSEAYPDSGTVPIGEDLNDINIHASFVLTGGDRAVGGGNFSVIPEPGGVALVVAGALVVLSTRRR